MPSGVTVPPTRSGVVCPAGYKTTLGSRNRSQRDGRSACVGVGFGAAVEWPAGAGSLFDDLKDQRRLTCTILARGRADQWVRYSNDRIVGCGVLKGIHVVWIFDWQGYSLLTVVLNEFTSFEVAPVVGSPLGSLVLNVGADQIIRGVGVFFGVMIARNDKFGLVAAMKARLRCAVQ